MLAINEEFLSYQGEGTKTGVRMYFVRLQGCAVGCHFCDTKYTWKKEQATTNEEDIVQRAKDSGARWVCITGGEPLEQNIETLVALLHKAGLEVQIETSGMYFSKVLSEIDHVVVSPKELFSKKELNEDVLNFADEIKCVVTKKEDIDHYLKQYDGCKFAELIFQCVDNSNILAEVIMNRKDVGNWRLMVQQQKVLEIQ